MYAIDQDLKKINDVIVDTFGRLIVDHDTVLEAEAGTTGYKGTPCRKAGGGDGARGEGLPQPDRVP